MSARSSGPQSAPEAGPAHPTGGGSTAPDEQPQPPRAPHRRRAPGRRPPSCSSSSSWSSSSSVTCSSSGSWSRCQPSRHCCIRNTLALCAQGGQTASRVEPHGIATVSLVPVCRSSTRRSKGRTQIRCEIASSRAISGVTANATSIAGTDTGSGARSNSAGWRLLTLHHPTRPPPAMIVELSTTRGRGSGGSGTMIGMSVGAGKCSAAVLIISSDT